MAAKDVAGCVELVSRAMDPEEGGYARNTFLHHFACVGHGIDDGRRLYVCEVEERVCGVVGLHFYVWGPPDNVWLSWFAVDPGRQGTGLGGWLFEAATELAGRLGYRKLFIETYSSDTFAKAARFYERHGFKRVGGIEEYLPDGASMVVFSRPIQPVRADAAKRVSCPDP